MKTKLINKRINLTKIGLKNLKLIYKLVVNIKPLKKKNLK